LTKIENQKTRQSFERSYVLKLFVFKALNNYGSLIYLAFGKQGHVG